jgi:hypothetical protein
MRVLAVLLMLCGPALAEEPLLPAFAEETATAGIDHRYMGDWQYMVGGGVAVFDCDADRFEDVFLAGGAGPSQLYRNVSVQGQALRFEPVDGMALDSVTGAYPLDVDNDGLMDLAVLRVGENRLLRGLGACRFQDASAEWGFDGGDAWSTAFAATWEKGADWPTIAIGNYIDRAQEDFPWGSCTDNWLHRAEGRRFAPALPLTPSFCALSMLFTDWNRSGRPSLRVSNDREYYEGGQEQLWHLEAGTPPRLYTESEGWARLRIWGMGIASQDVTGDGFPDYFLTSMADNKLQTLAAQPATPDAKPAFADVAFARGVTAHRPYTGGETRPSTAWHAQFDDVNNDGRADLFVAKGNVDAMPDFASDDPNNLLLQRADGTFLEAGDVAGVASMKSARGAALADFNRDGLLDLIVVNRREPVQIWRNVTSGAGHAVALWLRQGGSNRDAIGAFVEVKTDAGVQSREITIGGGHAGGQLGWRHFGLGAATTAEVRVIWPDGLAGGWQSVAADGFYLIDRDKPPQAVAPN